MTGERVLVTGGAGYIGSHTCVELLAHGYDVTVLDNYCNSSPASVDRIETISGRKVTRIHGDVRDAALVDKILQTDSYAGVLHFAGLKSVGESNALPLEYYDVNFSGSIILLKAMKRHGVKRFIFSSSATVYGEPQKLPLTEDHPLQPINPYGRSKLMVEDALRDLSLAEPDWAIAILRYFNPVGAHKSGLIGEFPRGIPNNLMPYIAQVAVGQREHLNIFGNDFDTLDGTGVRDFIHVVDLAKGHVKALIALKKQSELLTVNLGTGAGYSVMQLRDAFEKACGRPIAYKVVGRRHGDAAVSYADCSLANTKLDWMAEYGVQDMCDDAWRWQSQNPNGYE